MNTLRSLLALALFFLVIRADASQIHGGGSGGGATGTVTSVSGDNGVETTTGSPITDTGTLQGKMTLNSQVGTTYTFLTTDRGKLVTLNNASPVAVTLPQAGASFPSGWYVDVQNLGAGTATITPTISTIDGTTSVALSQNSGIRIASNGTNYFTQRGTGGGAAAPINATYLTQTANGTLNAEQALGALASGCLSVTTTTGVVASTGADCSSMTSVDATGGVETASGAPITTSGTIRGANLVNAQTGITYTVLTGDRGKLVTFTNASPIAVTLPQAGGGFPSGWSFYAENRGAGVVTITPTTSTIDGGTSVDLGTNQGLFIASDGTNYFTMRGVGGAPSSATFITQTANGTLTNEQALSALATGCVNVTTGTGVLGSTGVACAGGNLGIVVVDGVNSPYTTGAGDQVLLCDTSAANRTINLITASGNNGVHYLIKNIGGGQCTIDGAGAETIDGGSTAVLTVQYEAIELVAQSTGARWHIY